MKEICLSTDLRNFGIKIAINVNISVFKVGSTTQIKVMKHQTSC